MALREQRQGAANVWIARGGWAVEDALAGDWTRQAARVWPLAIGGAVAVIDFEAALIDGWLPMARRRRLVDQTQAHLARLNHAGVVPPAVQYGSVGRNARVVGAASLPLSERSFVNVGGTIARTHFQSAGLRCGAPPECGGGKPDESERRCN